MYIHVHTHAWMQQLYGPQLHMSSSRLHSGAETLTRLDARLARRKCRKAKEALATGTEARARDRDHLRLLQNLGEHVPRRLACMRRG